MKHENMAAWTEEEDRALDDMVARIGPAWTEICSSTFPDRTVSSVRNRFQRRRNGTRIQGRNKCRRCGQIKRGHTCTPIETSDDDDAVLLVSPVSTSMDIDLETSPPSPSLDAVPALGLTWETVWTLHELGFEGLKHPPPCMHPFPFTTSVPTEW